MGDQNDGGIAFLIPLLGVVICCGGPFLVIGLAAVGPSVLAMLGSPIPVVLVALALGGAVALLAKQRGAVDCPDCEHAKVQRVRTGMAEEAASQIRPNRDLGGGKTGAVPPANE